MNKYNSILSFVDLLFNLLLAFVCLFILSFLMINPQKQDGKIDPNAEFLVTLRWQDESTDDVDLWVEDPNGNVVSFVVKEAGLMHLDRDDRGVSQETVVTSDGSITSRLNQEIVTIRGYIKGEYVINTHMFSKRDEEPANITVQVLKLNPYQVVCEENILISENAIEKTICRFVLNSDGTIATTNKLPKSIMRAQ